MSPVESPWCIALPPTTNDHLTTGSKFGDGPQPALPRSKPEMWERNGDDDERGEVVCYIIILGATAREGPRSTSRLLASRPHSEVEMDDHPTRMEFLIQFPQRTYRGYPDRMIRGVRLKTGIGPTLTRLRWKSDMGNHTVLTDPLLNSYDIFLRYIQMEDESNWPPYPITSWPSWLRSGAFLLSLVKFIPVFEQLTKQQVDSTVKKKVFMFSKFKEVGLHDAGGTVHYWHLQKWAKEDGMRVELINFKECNAFIESFKRHFKITLRKITKFVAKRAVVEDVTIINRARVFVQKIQQYIDINDIEEGSAFNTNQSRFEYELTAIAHQ
ncbi:hypothetical protein ANN_13006 [Periplaneta americana]|uniref:Uncharacterized protein n=1 Tax=Periplaneta americana TaxID=6978 RepID=A0ABQ8TK68_PERAM|nr:hypothetical protein ANN_13006 [Periplaneta americana]